MIVRGLSPRVWGAHVPTALEAAVQAVVDDEHRAILEWFADHEGEIGPRPWRTDGRSALPRVSVPVVAQRGIHVPSRWTHAVSVTATVASKYGDGRPVDQGDGSWVLLYNAHRGGEGQGTGSRWNRGLMRCSADRVPVGVFVPASSAYLNLGLAMVDAYYPETDTFELHGPVDVERPADLFDFTPLVADEGAWPETEWELLAREEAADLEPDERLRIQATVVRRERRDVFRRSMLDLYGKCAVTEYEAPETLEAAHILQYRGKSSHSPQNGLLLRADVHQLFDKHLIAVDPSDGRIRTARHLQGTRYRDLEGRALRLPRDKDSWPSQSRLRMHFEVFLEV
jgi:hypothetical protein